MRFNMPSGPMVDYKKPPINHDQMIEKLKTRGLIIDDPESLKIYLKFIGYYRLAGYFRFFQIKDSSEEHALIQGTTFQQVLDSYIFDRELRLLVIDALERIEVATRAAINDVMGLAQGAHWYCNPAVFSHSTEEKRNHDAWLEKIHREALQSKHQFLIHYYNRYSGPKLPPCWMMAELASFGNWSKLFSAIKSRSYRKTIARSFNLTDSIFGSWLHSLTYVRNLCAHHSRLWNRHMPFYPEVHRDLISQMTLPQSFYCRAVIVWHFMNTIAPDTAWNIRLSALLDKYPSVRLEKMGFPKDWELDPFWKFETSESI